MAPMRADGQILRRLIKSKVEILVKISAPILSDCSFGITKKDSSKICSARKQSAAQCGVPILRKDLQKKKVTSNMFSYTCLRKTTQPLFCSVPLPSSSQGEGRCQLQIMPCSAWIPVAKTVQRTYAFISTAAACQVRADQI